MWCFGEGDEEEKGGKRENVPGVLVFDVLDGTAAFYASDCETCSVGEACNDSGLPFQRALKGFVEFGGLVEVNDVNVSVCCSDDKEFVFGVHAVDPFLTIDRCYRGGLP